MSDLFLTDKQIKKFPDRGDTDFLSPEENAFVQRILARPESFPQAFWSAIIQKVAIDGLVQSPSGVLGLPKALNTLGVIGTTYTDEPAGTVTTTFNGDVDTTGAVVSVPAGTYFCILTATATWTAGATNAVVRMYDNSGAVAFGSTGRFNGLAASGDAGAVMSIGSVAVTGASNDIKGRFSQEGAGSIDYTPQFLIALRTG